MFIRSFTSCSLLGVAGFNLNSKKYTSQTWCSVNLTILSQVQCVSRYLSHPLLTLQCLLLKCYHFIQSYTDPVSCAFIVTIARVGSSVYLTLLNVWTSWQIELKMYPST